MILIRFLIGLVAVPAAALAGNWVGDQLRASITGESMHEWRMVHETREGEKVIGINPRLTTFLPSVLSGFLGRPGWLSGFFAGLLFSLLLGSRLERPFWELVDRRLVSSNNRV
jgi:hypothetical protein